MQVLRADSARHAGHGQTIALELGWIHPNAHGAPRTEQLRATYTGHALQLGQNVAGHIVSHIIAAEARIGAAKRHRHQKIGVGALHLYANLLDHIRQARLYTRQAVLHVHLRQTLVGARLEGQGHCAATHGQRRRRHVHQPIHTVHFALNQRVDGFVDGGGIRPGVRSRHVDGGRRYRWIGRHRQQPHGNNTYQDDEDGHHPGKNRSMNKKLSHESAPA